MIFNYQNNSAWKNDTMALPEDTLGRYGCLITALANILTVKEKKDITPRILNQEIKDNKEFIYLDNPKEPLRFASCLVWDKFLKRKQLKLTRGLNFDNYEYADDFYWIAKVLLFNKYEHFINVLAKINNTLICFDVNDNQVKTYEKKDISELLLIKSMEVA